MYFSCMYCIDLCMFISPKQKVGEKREGNPMSNVMTHYYCRLDLYTKPARRKAMVENPRKISGQGAQSSRQHVSAENVLVLSPNASNALRFFRGPCRETGVGVYSTAPPYIDFPRRPSNTCLRLPTTVAVSPAVSVCADQKCRPSIKGPRLQCRGYFWGRSVQWLRVARRTSVIPPVSLCS